MARYPIAPAHPPLPSCRYFPFQFDAGGSQTANPMLESAVGLMIPLISQCAGTLRGAALGAPPCAPATAKGPSATILADVIVASGSFSPARLSQDCWARAGC